MEDHDGHKLQLPYHTREPLMTPQGLSDIDENYRKLWNEHFEAKKGVPSMSEDIWNRVMGRETQKQRHCGPFEVPFPTHLNMDYYLHWGPFDLGVQAGLADPSLRITKTGVNHNGQWRNKLMVHFTGPGEPTLQQQQALALLFTRVVEWRDNVTKEDPKTLSDSLRNNYEYDISVARQAYSQCKLDVGWDSRQLPIRGIGGESSINVNTNKIKSEEATEDTRNKGKQREELRGRPLCVRRYARSCKPKHTPWDEAALRAFRLSKHHKQGESSRGRK
ncbi:uncharacterized protein CTRU02_200507 [Colletotrichum truncatum]|uniref:Uncharacterized protein n=1 Tax=Colletotrichum truncatum TaxID=5467 RepID=A0ACC3ZES6_COLTU